MVNMNGDSGPKRLERKVKGRMLAGICLILFLIAVFPANVKAAREKLNVAGRPATPLVPRTAMQFAFIGLIWWSTLS